MQEGQLVAVQEGQLGQLGALQEVQGVLPQEVLVQEVPGEVPVQGVPFVAAELRPGAQVSAEVAEELGDERPE